MEVNNRKLEIRKVAISFITEIIVESITRFNLTFDEVDEILTELGYWDVFIDDEVTCVGAHDGVEPVLQEIADYLESKSK